MVKMVAQPIVDVVTRTVVMEEMFCRPAGCIREYFDVNDLDLLWKRELNAILQGLKQKNGLPVNLNITLLSLPNLYDLELSWLGGIELVEWGKSQVSASELSLMIHKLREDGLEVWVDDVTPSELYFWNDCGVSGYKVEVDLLDDSIFADRLLKTRLPVIVERVETKDDEKRVLDCGFRLAQGYLYGKPV